MAEDLQKEHLLVVSDTAMAYTKDGILVFEPALREMENLLEVFTHITWIGFNYKSDSNLAMRCPETQEIDFILLPKATGGDSFFSKLRILPYLPYLLIVIVKNVLRHKVVHTRGPSIPALIVSMISLVDTSRLYWHKYAGNWMQEKSPIAYALHRWLLKLNKRTVVTINGSWSGQQKHILSFENPCLTVKELQYGLESYGNKSYDGRLTILFVGNLIPSKGLHKILDALRSFSAENIEQLLVAGDGPQRNELEVGAKSLCIPVIFSGAISRAELQRLYTKSHIILLPSQSEGFPKVIAEAAAFGCVPVVSNVSSISQYISDGFNGILLEKEANGKEIASALSEFILNREKLAFIAGNATKMAGAFTYEVYNERVRNEILGSRK
ncbi:MAG: glycosyltransferase family 4 protein [Cyclobacteriaceae bacterium]|nr:glycosyltransferase family 4 protein [Cyclobacteriaceae bacterium]